MPVNKISLRRQREILDEINAIRLDTGMTYPQNTLQEIMQRYVPDVLITESNFNGNEHIKGAVFRKSPEFDRPAIAIQENQPARAKNFALAHEFGHYVLKHNPDSNFLIDTRKFDGTDAMQDEGEANFFAMALLMPRDEFEELDQPFVSSKRLAEYFGVTEAQVSVRRDWLRSNGY